MTNKTILLRAYLSGCTNKVTDLIDDEGLFRLYEGTTALFVFQVFLKVFFPWFFVQMFITNKHAAAIFAATYFFAWILRGKVGLPSKPLETNICILFLVPAWSLVGGSMSDQSFSGSFYLAFAAHFCWLKIGRKSSFAVRYKMLADMITESGVFRYAPALLLCLVHPDQSALILQGVMIVACDNVGYCFVKSLWRIYQLSQRKNILARCSRALGFATPNMSVDVLLKNQL